MKKLLLIAFLVGCGGNVPQATTTPDPVEAAPQEANAYMGVMDVLYAIIEMESQEFASFCSDINGAYNADMTGAGFATCLGADGSGFAQRAYLDVPFGSAVLVPEDHGQLLADAVFAAVGSPQQVIDSSGVWELNGFTMVFTTIPNGMWLLVLERTGTVL